MSSERKTGSGGGWIWGILAAGLLLMLLSASLTTQTLQTLYVTDADEWGAAQRRSIADEYIAKSKLEIAERERQQHEQDKERLTDVGVQPFSTDKPTLFSIAPEEKQAEGRYEKVMRVKDLKPGEGGFVVPGMVGELDAFVERTTGGAFKLMVWRDADGNFYWESK